MSVPKAPVDENDQIMPRHHNIRFSREPFIMKTESKTHAVQQFPDYKFWLGVAPFDFGHDIATFFFGKDV